MNTSGVTSSALLADKAAAGLGVIGAQLADHVGEILVIDPADALQRPPSARAPAGRGWRSAAPSPGRSGRRPWPAARCIPRGCGRRSRAGRATGPAPALARPRRGLASSSSAMSDSGVSQIAGLVQLSAIASRQPAVAPAEPVQLGQQMFGERRFAALPAGRNRNPRRSLPRSPNRRHRQNCRSPAPGRASRCRAADRRSRPAMPISSSDAGIGSAASSPCLAVLGVDHDRRYGRRFAFARPRLLEQRVLGQLLGDTRFELEIAELQQLDRLLQLRASAPATAIGGCRCAGRAPWLDRPPKARSFRRGRAGGPLGLRPAPAAYPGTAPGHRR